MGAIVTCPNGRKFGVRNVGYVLQRWQEVSYPEKPRKPHGLPWGMSQTTAWATVVRGSWSTARRKGPFGLIWTARSSPTSNRPGLKFSRCQGLTNRNSLLNCDQPSV